MFSYVAEWYLRLAPAYPPALWTNPGPIERATREYESEVRGDSDSFLPHFPHLNLADKVVLDLGCGAGGRSVCFKEQGAARVVGTEIMADMLEEAERFAGARGVGVDFLRGPGEAIPAKADTFDVVISYDVFEHVEDVRRCLQESYRVLKPGGALYAVFPPIHHPTGGSHFHGYISKSPAPTLLFPREALLKAIRRIEAGRGQDPMIMRPRNFLPSVNGTTVADLYRHAAAVPFRRRQIHLQPLRSNRLWYLNRIFHVASRIPLLREITTDRIVAEFTK